MVQLCTFGQAWGSRKKREESKQEPEKPLKNSATTSTTSTMDSAAANPLAKKEIVLQPKAIALAPSTVASPSSIASPSFTQKPSSNPALVTKEEGKEYISIHVHRQMLNLFFYLHIASLAAILILVILK
jgi:hypothetical protein